MVLPTPLYHCLGSVGGTMVSMTHGITLILPSPSFDGKKALEAISRERWASVGSHPWATETLLFLTHGPSSLSKISPPSSQEKWKHGNGEMETGVVGDPRERTSSCFQRASPACCPPVAALVLTQVQGGMGEKKELPSTSKPDFEMCSPHPNTEAPSCMAPPQCLWTF